MKKFTKFIGVLILIAIIALIVVPKILNRVKYNDTYVNGNTAGNLYNAGLFCESNGTIFFANPDDNYTLYSMTPTGGDLKKLCDDSCMYINADNNYVYYVRNNTKTKASYSFFSYNNNSLCRISRNGGKEVIIDEAPCIYASLIGNYIYYLHYDTKTATTLYKIKIDGKEKKQLSDTYLFTCSSLDKYFYYNSPKDGQLYKYDTSTDNTSLVLSCNCYNPIALSEDNIYYLDVSKNNALVHTSVSSNKPVVLSDDFIELYNVYGSYVFYQRGGSNPALCMIKNDGTDYRELVAGEFKNINVTSFYIYFQDFETGQTFYMSTNSPDGIHAFSPGVKN